MEVTQKTFQIQQATPIASGICAFQISKCVSLVYKVNESKSKSSQRDLILLVGIFRLCHFSVYLQLFYCLNNTVIQEYVADPTRTDTVQVVTGVKSYLNIFLQAVDCTVEINFKSCDRCKQQIYTLGRALHLLLCI